MLSKTTNKTCTFVVQKWIRTDHLHWLNLVHEGTLNHQPSACTTSLWNSWNCFLPEHHHPFLGGMQTVGVKAWDRLTHLEEKKKANVSLSRKSHPGKPQVQLKES